MEEEWRELKEWKGIDFSGCFLVSNMGNIKTIDRWIPCSSGKKQHRKSIHLKKYMDDGGYLRVSICKNRVHKNPRVHTLVMYLFNPNPNPEIYTEINHIDENKTNNRLDNLEWVTHKENMNHGTARERASEAIKDKFIPIIQTDLGGNIINIYNRREQIEYIDPSVTTEYIIRRIKNGRYIYKDCLWIREPEYRNLDQKQLLSLINKQLKINETEEEKRVSAQRRKIVQLQKDGSFVTEWPSVKDAAEYFSVKTTTINAALEGANKTCQGYIWLLYDIYAKSSYQELQEIIKNINTNPLKKSVVQLDLNNNMIKIWNSITEAKDSLGISGTTSICACLKNKRKTCKGFKWMYLEDYEKVQNDGKATEEKESAETESKEA